MEEMLKSNRKDQQLENEIYLLKQAFYRVSKRIVLLENFIKNKFVDEFPRSSIVVRNTKWSTPRGSSKVVTKLQAIVDLHPAAAVLSFENDTIDESISSKKISEPEGEVFLIDSEGQPIDWESNIITEDVSTELPISSLHDPDQDQDHQHNALHEVQPGSSLQQANSIIVPRNDEDSDSDMEYLPDDTDPPSPGYEVEIDKTDQDALKWLVGDEQSSSESDNDRKKTKGKRKYVKKQEVPKARSRGRPKKQILNVTCTICSRVFLGTQASSNLKAHMDIHSAARKYECNVCKKTFRQKRPLRTHIQRIHETEKYATHVCQFCGRKFVSPREKIHHEQTHTGERPYNCEICGFSCIQAHNLVRHKAIHSGRKDVLCPQCGKAFSNNERLRAHSKNVHEVELGPDGKRLKSVVCEICSATFTNVGGRRSHMVKIHGVKSNSIKDKPQYLIIVKEDLERNSKDTTEAVDTIPSE